MTIYEKLMGKTFKLPRTRTCPISGEKHDILIYDFETREYLTETPEITITHLEQVNDDMLLWNINYRYQLSRSLVARLINETISRR